MSINGRTNYGRYEFKYAIPSSLCPALVKMASPHICSDPHAKPLPCGGLGYTVHSIYYDTFNAHGEPTLEDYFERLAANKVRDRLRVRTYGTAATPQPVFLENKRKQDDRVVKARVKICTSHEWAASNNNRPWTDFGPKIKGQKRHAFKNFSTLIQYRSPVSVVHYDREVFIDRNPFRSKVRLTIDRNVTATTRPMTLDPYAPATVDLIPRDWVVLELKFGDDRPGWMRQLVRTFKLRAVPVSKFGLSVALGFRTDHPDELRFFTPAPLRRMGIIARPALHTTAAEAAS